MATIADMFSVALASVGVVKDLTKLTIDANVDAKVRAAVLDAVGKLGNAQTAMYDLREELFKIQTENERLKCEATEIDNWSEKIFQYALTKTDGGAIVYKSTGGDPQHYACPVCVGQRKLFPLQDLRVMSGLHSCPSCKAKYLVNAQIKPARLNYPRSGGGGSWMSS